MQQLLCLPAVETVSVGASADWHLVSQHWAETVVPGHASAQQQPTSTSSATASLLLPAIQAVRKLDQVVSVDQFITMVVQLTLPLLLPADPGKWQALARQLYMSQQLQPLQCCSPSPCWCLQILAVGKLSQAVVIAAAAYRDEATFRERTGITNSRLVVDKKNKDCHVSSHGVPLQSTPAAWDFLCAEEHLLQLAAFWLSRRNSDEQPPHAVLWPSSKEQFVLLITGNSMLQQGEATCAEEWWQQHAAPGPSS